MEDLDWGKLAATSAWTSSKPKYRCLGNSSGDVHIWNRFRQSQYAQGRTLVSGALSFPVAKLTHLWNDNLICCMRETETTDGFVDGWGASSWTKRSFPTSDSTLSHALILRVPWVLLITAPVLFFLSLIPLRSRKPLQSTLMPTFLFCPNSNQPQMKTCMTSSWLVEVPGNCSFGCDTLVRGSVCF